MGLRAICQIISVYQFIFVIIMYQDLDRIRCLETRMRKRQLIQPTLETQDQKEQELIFNSKDNKQTEQIYGIKNDKIPPKVTFHSPDVNVIDGLDQEHQEVSKKNKKLTDFYRQGRKQDLNSPQDKIVSKAVEARKNRESKMVQPSEFTSPSCQVIEENKSLRQRLKQKQDQFLKDKKRMKDMIINYAIENHRYQRNEIRAKIFMNKMRLGEFITHKDNGKISEIWMDGQQIKNIKQKIEEIGRKKIQLEKELKTVKPKKDNDADFQGFDSKTIFSCQLMLLNRDEENLKVILAKLEDQKSVHIKDFKRLYQEDNSKYGKPNPTTGITSWPKINNYQLLCLLGKGGFSEVYKAFDTEEMREVACKIHQFDMRWADDAKDNYIRHAIRQNNVQKLLKHPHIVTLYHTVEIDRTSFITVMEYCNGPDLSYYLRKHKCIPEKQAKLMIRQILYAIKYMHELLPQKIIHYDLKPQNILFHDGQLKVTDFGLCKTMKMGLNKMQLTSQGVGTYWYLPPQCFIENATITPKVDIWSVGVIYYQMLFHQKPFGHNMSQLRILKENIIVKSKNAPFEFPSKPFVSEESKSFIRDCLKYSDTERMDAVTALNHCLFQKK